MSTIRSGGALCSAAFLVVLSLAVGQFASAAPPPPPEFWQMTISNGCPDPVTAITLQFHPSAPDTYNSLDEPIQLVIPKLATGKTITVDLFGVHGIAKITANATCAAPIQQLVITAPMGDYDNDGDQEYAGFCPKSASGTTYLPTLEFVVQGGQQVAKLHAKWRWDTNWAQNAVMATTTCPP